MQLLFETQNQKKPTLIIGAGQIGWALKNILDNVYDVKIRDKQIKKETESYQYEVINITYPYSDHFVEITKKYIDHYKPKLTIIHSTIKPGTSRAIGYNNIVYSPVNGRHPDLINGIKTFIKIVSGFNAYAIYEAVEYLNTAGINTVVFSSPEAAELAKILCTTQYGIYIMAMKEIVRICEEYNVPFTEVYTDWNTYYNEGYIKLEEPRFLRNILFPWEGEIGGHCVIPNCDFIDDFLTNLVKQKNEEYKKYHNLSSRTIGDFNKSDRQQLQDTRSSMDRKRSKDRK